MIGLSTLLNNAQQTEINHITFLSMLYLTGSSKNILRSSLTHLKESMALTCIVSGCSEFRISQHSECRGSNQKGKSNEDYHSALHHCLFLLCFGVRRREMGRLSSVLNYIFLIAKKVTDDNICVCCH